MQTEIIKEQVKYVFRHEELVDIARDQARHHESMRQAEAEFDQVKAAQKAKVSRLEADISDCTRRVSAGYEMRNVDCLVLKFRPDGDHVLIVRTDTGRVIRKRKLDAVEKQLKFSDKRPESFAVQVTLWYDGPDGVPSELAGDDIPLFAEEAERLRDVEGLEFRPLRKLLEAPEPPIDTNKKRKKKDGE